MALKALRHRIYLIQTLKDVQTAFVQNINLMGIKNIPTFVGSVYPGVPKLLDFGCHSVK